MSPPVFLVAAVPAGDRAVLDGAEGRHAARVRRLRPGEPVCLSDGAGNLADCTVAEVGTDRLTLSVVRRVRVEAGQPRLVVVQALAKGERGELAVELMTEVGADRIVPWAAARSVVQWRAEGGARALGRWRATAREAAKQSRRAWLPEVSDLHCTDQVCGLLAASAAGVVLHESALGRIADVRLPGAGDLVVVVGPEGGVEDGELSAFRAAGAQPVRLGPSVLRTSTAGAAALAVLAARTGRWS